jgi:predicted helicase
MEGSEPLDEYLKAISKNLAQGDATEHTHRPALKALLEALESGITATNEPRRIEVGAPDFILLRGAVPVGYIETKDIGVSLQDALKTEQLQRYLALPNLILTDYLDFQWFLSGELKRTARIARPDARGGLQAEPGGASAVASLLRAFLAQETPVIGTARELAERMAGVTQQVRELINATFAHGGPGSDLEDLFAGFRRVLIPDLTPSQFADMYAQTIAYGLFAACCNIADRRSFSREHAAYDLPKTNPFLRKVFTRIAGPDLDDRVAWAVDQLAALLRASNMEEILKDFARTTGREDPVVHFYETFLRAYDPEERKIRGVYYTPEPIVSYIVRSVDYLLKTRFDLPKGLADDSVLILDPACGTGTFLYEVINEIHRHVVEHEGAGMWSSYVREKLLRRIFGFEIMMAPYAIAHMKLGIQLRDLGYDFSGDERLGIYLTNTLEEAAEKSERLIEGWIHEEASAAAEIKRDKPIMVVLGNPPYSISSQNRGEWVNKLLEDYKQGLHEKKLNLDDDYIKFIRFGQWRIEQTGHGILAFISNNSYIDGITHRRMRESLMETFPEIYIMDLHGNSRRREVCPDGSKDENVFDIQQGTCVGVFARPQGLTRRRFVRHAEEYGSRDRKYTVLSRRDVSTTRWTRLSFDDPRFFFVRKDLSLSDEFEQYWSVVRAFPLGQNALKTDRDALFFDFDAKALEERMRRLFALHYDDVFRSRYQIRASSSYDIEARVRRAGFAARNLHPCVYRPFDLRWLYYDPAVTSRPAYKVMRHMLAGQNVGLLVTRQTRDPFAVMATKHLAGHKSMAAYDINSLIPLYVYPDDGTYEAADGRRPNLSDAFVKDIAGRLGLRFVPDGRGDLRRTFGPEDVFHYMYAVFHAPSYRCRYAELLAFKFPRIPLTNDLALFAALTAHGAELLSLHLMESPRLEQFFTRYQGRGDDTVEDIRYTEPKGDTPGRVYINRKQYFEGISPDLWQFPVGGYRPMYQWLKDRKGRVLTNDDLTHYQRIAVALTETMRLMQEIDQVIPGWPLP